ncbi:hypothetical protein LCGC14_2270160 [marine sediment metagenome]|uniref:Uncharacterized protein n=1 Tax=marine sediment metagenome TaxID=412755 RepID=A0A0F9DJE9_9ZZZZ
MSFKAIITKGFTHRSVVLPGVQQPIGCPFCFKGKIRKSERKMGIWTGQKCDGCAAELTHFEEYDECEGCD